MRSNTEAVSLLKEIARSVERRRLGFLREYKAMVDDSISATNVLSAAHSGSWLGYQSAMYINRFRARTVHDVFDVEWGTDVRLTQTRGDWASFEPGDVDAAWFQVAKTDVESVASLRESTRALSRSLCHERKKAALALGKHLGDFEQLMSDVSLEVDSTQMLSAMQPQKVVSRDVKALQGGIVTPRHLVWGVEAIVAKLVVDAADTFVHAIESCVDLMDVGARLSAKGDVKKALGNRVFIGHGRSIVWRDLKDFLSERLGLKWVEFNSEPSAGMATKERLEIMLDDAMFAFVVMTGEDEQPDGTVRARENVVHEAGLFQGRLGFRKTVILLEEGCEEFSNIVGLTQVRFPEGNVSAKFEEIRRILEREEVL